MPGIEIGTVCIKTRGRESGKKAVIVDFDSKTKFVVIDGPQIKKRKCNLMHLYPTSKKIDIKKNADKKTIEAQLKTMK